MGPIAPPGGVAATSTKVAKHRQGADGVVVQMFCSSLNNHPVCADSGCFAIFSFWHSHPSCPGGAMGLIPIRSQLHRPRLYRAEKALREWPLFVRPLDLTLEAGSAGEGHDVVASEFVAAFGPDGLTSRSRTVKS